MNKKYRTDLNLWEEVKIYDSWKPVKQYIYRINTGNTTWELHRLHKPISKRTARYISKAYITKIELEYNKDYTIEKGHLVLI